CEGSGGRDGGGGCGVGCGRIEKVLTVVGLTIRSSERFSLDDDDDDDDDEEEAEALVLFPFIT
ncbi:unnamed protein product, partial [Rotaria socialis]